MRAKLSSLRRPYRSSSWPSPCLTLENTSWLRTDRFPDAFDLKYYKSPMFLWLMCFQQLCVDFGSRFRQKLTQRVKMTQHIHIYYSLGLGRDDELPGYRGGFVDDEPCPCATTFDAERDYSRLSPR